MISAAITTYAPEELLGTKIRALYQRRKGRDLFDLWYSYAQGFLNPEETVNSFLSYMEKEGHAISRQAFADNLQAKMKHPAFQTDTPHCFGPGSTTIRYKPPVLSRTLFFPSSPAQPEPRTMIELLP